MSENPSHRREPSTSSLYMQLLSSLASDLDFMLTDLCPSPPPLSSPLSVIRGDAFLEPYMEGLGREDTKPGVRSLTSSPVLHLQDNRRVSPPFTILDLQSDNRQSSIDQVDGVCGEEESADEETSGGSSRGSDCGDTPPCDIGLMERLIRSHPVWFLPGIQRAGAFHLLQGKEEGNFVVRQSSQSSTMAISVRLPAGKGPYIEHYLIQAAPDGQLSLESSENKFPSIPGLIAHYCQCCDELPVQLTLPRAVRDAKNRQQLSSLALLGQEFWRYPMANPRPIQTSEPSTQQVSESTTGLNSSLPSSQASSLSSFGSGNNNNNNAGRSPTGDPDSIVLNLTPLADHNQPSSLLSTFKTLNENGSPKSAGSCESPPVGKAVPQRAPRPTPPNTLNLSTLPATGPNNNSKPVSSPPSSLGIIPAKTPPPPPPRWSKPAPNFTVTTTVTFSMTETTSSSSPPPNQIEPGTISKQESICDSESLPSIASGTATLDSNRASIKSPMSEPIGHVLSPAGSDTRSSILSPVSDSKPPHRRSKRHKESRHYQESDILESPDVYYRSSVADKVSDYEDIWGPESMTTFKPRSSPFTSPEEAPRRVPDILDRIPPCPAPRPSLVTTPAAPHPSPLTPPEPQTPTEQTPTIAKQSSPFYCEPADAIKSAFEVTRRRNRNTHRNNRHSDPATLIQWPSIAPPGVLERIDSKEELTVTGLSSSVDNLVGPKRLGRRIGILERGKSKPKVAKRPQGKLSETWAVDSSWEFIGNEEEPQSEHDEVISPDDSFTSDRKFPSLEQQEIESPGSRGITIHQIIAKRCPGLALFTDVTAMRNDTQKLESGNGSRVSAYDNVSNQQNNGASTLSHISDDDTQTIFSEPWDSSRWETLLERGDDWQRGEERVNMVRTKSFRERLDPFLCAPRLAALQKTRENGGTGASIRSYTLQLATDKTTVFAQTIDNFIECTRESKETRPQVVMRNMRQFMTGMKNYLVTHGEREFERQVEKERSKLRADEFLNLDAILEGVMHKLVVRPLKEHLYRLFVDEYTDSGAIQLLSENIQYARTKQTKDIGIRPNIILPNNEAMDEICSYLQKLQEVDSPLEKLETLLTSIASIFNNVKVSNNNKGRLLLGADDFLPLFVWVLVQSGMVAAEIEADYMWGLLHPSLLSGEGGYYLTTLSSAVHVLKSFRACSEEFTASGASLNWGTGSGPLAEFRSVLKIVVPDERNGSIITKTLPIRPNMTTKDVCKIIAHKIRITNPQDYALYKLIDGEETILTDAECPQDIKGNLGDSGKHCMFAYKRIEAKIAWPRHTSQ